MILGKILMSISLFICIWVMSGIPNLKFDIATCEYWVAPVPVGNDANPGTSVQPWATLEFASEVVPDAGCTVWFMPGIYFGEHRINRRFENTTTFMSWIPYQAILMNNGAVVIISGGKNLIIDGFDIQHMNINSTPLVVAIDQSDDGWAENITLRNNLIHDSYNDDLLKIYNGCKNILIEKNLFFNQGDSGEQIDVNSVIDVVIQKNIFFNSFESSGRQDTKLSKQYIVIKDSNGTDDGLVGSKNITVQKNVFLNWQGQEKETMVQVGLDGKPYHEAESVYIQNNLFIGNSDQQIGSVFGVRGAKDVFVLNNSVVGDFPALSYAFRVTIVDQNPKNQNIYFVNNIWSDPTGTMGDDLEGSGNEFSDGDITETENLVLLNNLYWNGGLVIPDGDLVSPLVDDNQRVIGDPMVETDHEDIVLPVWTGTEFLSGELSIQAEFSRLVNLYAMIDRNSPAVGNADPAFAPNYDILSNFRLGKPDIGSYQYMDWFYLWLPLMRSMR